MKWEAQQPQPLFRLETIHGLSHCTPHLGIKQQVAMVVDVLLWFRDITVKELQLYA
jgi:hypothetical protein